jgi:hypothetical protein
MQKGIFHPHWDFFFKHYTTNAFDIVGDKTKQM